MAAKLIDKDHGWKAFRDRLRRTEEASRVRVGVQGSDAEAEHEGGITNVRLAAVHEFGATIDHPGGTPYVVTQDGARFVPKGTPGTVGVTAPHAITIPERSFIRGTVDEQAQKYRAFAKALALKVIDGKTNTWQALGLLGARVVADVRRRIQRGIEPPLAPSTVKRKKSSKPLVDTGQLLNSISYQVERERQSGETLRGEVSR